MKAYGKEIPSRDEQPVQKPQGGTSLDILLGQKGLGRLGALREEGWVKTNTVGQIPKGPVG